VPIPGQEMYLFRTNPGLEYLAALQETEDACDEAYESDDGAYYNKYDSYNSYEGSYGQTVGSYYRFHRFPVPVENLRLIPVQPRMFRAVSVENLRFFPFNRLTPVPVPIFICGIRSF